MNKKQRERIERLLPGGIPRWVRCYDNGGAYDNTKILGESHGTADRYTVVYTRNVSSGTFQYVGMSASPFHPQGICQHGESAGNRPIDAPGNNWAPAIGRRCHLGKRIRFQDLPEDCRAVALNDYREIWNLPANRAEAAANLGVKNPALLADAGQRINYETSQTRY